MAYAIMRCKKLASVGSVASSLKHCYRDRETPNADMARTPENEHHGAKSTNEAMGKLRELLPEKRRKDAVLAVEYLMTASPEWWKEATPQQQEDFFQKSRDWLASKYGPDRIIVATVHRDETSPHLSAFVVPLTKDGRLSAKDFIGDRHMMSSDQTTYAKAVQHLGLERGIEGSRARHQTVQSYYAAIQKTPGQVTITPQALVPRKFEAQGLMEKLGLTTREEAPEAIAERLTAAVRGSYAPAVLAAAGARQERQKAQEAQATALGIRNRLRPVVEALAPLSHANQAKALLAIEALGHRMQEAQQLEQKERMAARPGQDKDRGFHR